MCVDAQAEVFQVAQLSRREFLVRLGIGGVLTAAYGLQAGRTPADASPSIRSPNSQNRSNDETSPVVIRHSKNLHFGTSIYPFRKNQDPAWLLSEAGALGLNELRVGYPRQRVERQPNYDKFDPQHFHEPSPQILNLLRDSHFLILMVLQGPGADTKGNPVDWPRTASGSIDGLRAAEAHANYAHWTINRTKDFVDTYELWNEAFGKIDDPRKKSFGPGGSLENADNYAAMMIPTANLIRKLAEGRKIAVEGNYWNLSRSVGSSPDFQHLLQMADFVVRHPYGYQPESYERIDPERGTTSAMDLYRTYNSNLKWWFSEYGVSPHDVGLTPGNMPEIVQAKAVLRSTVLHLLHDIEHLDVFCLYYPTIPHYTLIDETGRRKPAFFALQKLIASLTPRRQCLDLKIKRLDLPADCKDLCLTTTDGFTYLIWQETSVKTFTQSPPSVVSNPLLKLDNGGSLRLESVTDPIKGMQVADAIAHAVSPSEVRLSIPVQDYPLICRFRATQ